MSKSKSSALGRRETFFAEAISLKSIEGSTTSFSANIPWDWSSYIATQGGFTASLIMAAARTYHRASHPASSQPDPISSIFNFLFPVPFGPAILTVKELSLGTKVSVIQVELQAQVMEKLRTVPGKFRVCTVATITMGNLAEEKGISLPSKSVVRKKEIPDREKECVELVSPDALRDTFPIMFKNRRWDFKSDVDGKEKQEEKSVRGFWISMSNDEPWDVLSLGLMCDSFAPVPSVYIPPVIGDKLGLTYPTLSMSLEIKRDPKGSRYMFLKLVAYAIWNGRFDTDVFAYDEEGELVALGRHVSLIQEPKRKTEDYEKELGKLLKL